MARHCRSCRSTPGTRVDLRHLSPRVRGNVHRSFAVTAASFDPTKFSAFAVASVSSCGGCDNPPGTGAMLAAFSTSIASFFDAGGGILGLTGSTDPTAFWYVPDAASGSPIASTSGFVATTAGTTDIPGFFAVNGDQTHNIFTDVFFRLRRGRNRRRRRPRGDPVHQGRHDHLHEAEWLRHPWSAGADDPVAAWRRPVRPWRGKASLALIARTVGIFYNGRRTLRRPFSLPEPQAVRPPVMLQGR